MKIMGVQAMIKGLAEGDQLQPALEKVAIKVEREAKRLCPVDTGRLRSSISHGVFHDERGIFARVGSGANGLDEPVEYAVYQEYGTSRQAGTPHLRPALTSVLGRLSAAGQSSSTAEIEDEIDLGDA